MMTINSLATEIQACRLCRDAPIFPPILPHEPRPVAVLSSTAPIVICGQAPGNKVNQTGIPFNDPSGDRLRQWLGVSRDVFYNPDYFSIIPMGFCFPGYDKHGGDLPPRKECRQIWHDRVFASMPQLRVVLTIGHYAQAYHLKRLGMKPHSSVTETVAHWRDYLHSNSLKEKLIPLPHPSWRNSGWLKRNPWFETELLPSLRQLVHSHLPNQQ